MENTKRRKMFADYDALISSALMEYKEIGTVGFKTQIEWSIDFPMDDEESGTAIACQSSNFVFENSSWFLRLLLEFDDESNSDVTIYIVSSTSREYPVEYELGLKKQNGHVEYSARGIMEAHKTGSGPCDLITVSDLLLRKREFVRNNVLTIMCTLKRGTANSTQSSEWNRDKKIPLKLLRLDKLSENFENLYANKETCDVILKVQDKEFKAHKLVLMARSNVFAATFKHDTLESQTGIITIPDCDPDSFHEFLEYLYSGRLEEISFRSALNLFYTSEKYDVPELKAFCIDCLTKCLTVETVCEVAILADKCDDEQLFKAVQCFFNISYADILLTSEWKQLLYADCRLADKLLTEMAKIKHKSKS